MIEVMVSSRLTRSFFPMFFAIMVAWFGWVSNSAADMVWLKGESRPRFGTIVSQSSTAILFREFTSKNTDNIPIQRDQIESLVINVDPQRLSALSPDDWSAYRDYAEELAIQKLDPVARQLAVRLYLIAANGSLDELRNSCLIGLISLAENEQQREQYQLLRQLVGGSGDASAEKSNEANHPAEEVTRGILLRIIRFIRQEKQAAAILLLEDLPTDPRSAADSLSNMPAQLKRIALMARLERLDLDHLSRLLQLEIYLIDGTTPPTKPEKNWSSDARQTALNTIELPSFQNVTPYDPNACLYRSGQWVRAD